MGEIDYNRNANRITTKCLRPLSYEEEKAYLDHHLGGSKTKTRRSGLHGTPGAYAGTQGPIMARTAKNENRQGYA